MMKLVGMERLDPFTPVNQIPLAQRQLTELAKALADVSRLLILDEPTAALTEPQAQRLHEIIRDLASNGTSVIYISHRLKDVLDVSGHHFHITGWTGGGQLAGRNRHAG